MTNNIVVLNSQTMPYHMASFRQLVKKGYNVHIVNKDKLTLSSFNIKDEKGIYSYPRSTLDKQSIYELLLNINPIIILCAGTIDRIYLKVLGIYRKSNGDVPIIMFSDTQWRGGKQWYNVLTRKFRHQKWFTHVLVAGMWQYEYARKLGFSRHNIIAPYLSADTSLFTNVDIERKKSDWPKKLLYVGRFANEKGLDILYNAWNSILDHNGWKLILVGEGPLKPVASSNIEVVGYKTQSEIVDIMQEVGAFILPSRFEPWALVIHEAAAAGLPIISSDCVGASQYFCISGSNSFVFGSEKTEELILCLNRLFNLSSEQLYRMGFRSRQLSVRITSEDVADAILSTIN